MKNAQEKAKILVEALPYIREFHGKTIVVKCGGELLASEEVKKNISKDVALMKFVGIKPIIIHGGGPQVTQLLEKQGKRVEFIEGMRKTDEETIKVVEKVLSEVNKDFVNLISNEGAQAIGFSGKNGKLIKAKKIKSSKGEDLGMVGEVEEIDSSKINELEEKNMIPVIAPLGEENGNILNINADMVASDIAVALKAEKMIILTNKPGIMKDMCDDNSLISSVSLSEIDSLIEKGIIHGGMLPKIKACRKAITEGVNKTHIIDGRVEHCILLEVFTDKGVGTEITKDKG
jgi:acetylglutamate kinase